MAESLYFQWIRDRNAIVEECGGWTEYLATVERLHVGSRLFAVMADPMWKRIYELSQRYSALVAEFKNIVGGYRTFRHADTRHGTLTEIELSNGDSFLGYDLIDALEQAADSRRRKSDDDDNHAGRTPQRETGRCEANR